MQTSSDHSARPIVHHKTTLLEVIINVVNRLVKRSVSKDGKMRIPIARWEVDTKLQSFNWLNNSKLNFQFTIVPTWRCSFFLSNNLDSINNHKKASLHVEIIKYIKKIINTISIRRKLKVSKEMVTLLWYSLSWKTKMMEIK